MVECYFARIAWKKSSRLTMTRTFIQLLLLLLLVVVVVVLLLLLLLLLLGGAFSRFLPEEPVGGYTEVQKAWQAWTFVDFGEASSGQDGRAGGADATDCAGMGFGAIRAGGFLPVETAGGYKIVARTYFCGRGACIQYDPKLIVGAKTVDPKGDAYYGS